MENKIEKSSTNRLTKDKSDVVFAGVCSGLARSMGIQPLWVRLGFVASTLAWGVGLLPYILLAILMPNE